MNKSEFNLWIIWDNVEGLPYIGSKGRLKTFKSEQAAKDYLGVTVFLGTNKTTKDYAILKMSVA